jgi:hypothetical protein
VLLVLAALAGGLTFAMAREVGLAAVTGRKAVAHATHCRGVKARTCDAEVTDLAGNTIAFHASLSGFTRVADGALVHVRYRDGRATAASPPPTPGPIRPSGRLLTSTSTRPSPRA